MYENELKNVQFLMSCDIIVMKVGSCMDRKYLKYFEEWIADPLRKPLIVYGARQVGKTTLIRDIFAPLHFKKIIYIDFKVDVDERVYIKNHINPKNILDYLSIKNDITIDEDTLLIFDEVQECLPCLTSLKYFCEKYRHIPVIVTGSMIRTKIGFMKRRNGQLILDPEIDPKNQDGNNNYMFPTGKVNILNMYCMSFNEYLFNRNRSLYNLIEVSFKEKKTLDDETHSLALSIVYEYLAIGGMPEAVDKYLTTRSFVQTRKTLRELYSRYIDDMVLFQISNETLLRTRNVFENIYKQLTKNNKNFKFSLIEKDKKYRDYYYALEWLELGKIVYKSKQLKQRVTVPLLEDDNSLFRIYFSDVGLFSLQSGVGLETFLDDLKNKTLSGIFFENFVAEELENRNINLFFWKGKTSSELEFVLDYKNVPTVIDVKKNKGSLDSLDKFREMNTKELAIKISANKYGYNEEKKLLTLPFYYVGFFLDENIEDIKISIE